MESLTKNIKIEGENFVLVRMNAIDAYTLKLEIGKYAPTILKIIKNLDSENLMASELPDLSDIEPGDLVNLLVKTTSSVRHNGAPLIFNDAFSSSLTMAWKVAYEQINFNLGHFLEEGWLARLIPSTNKDSAKKEQAK